jgi:hypothetical protein
VDLTAIFPSPGLIVLDLALAPEEPLALATQWTERLPGGTRLAVIDAGLSAPDHTRITAMKQITVLRRDPKLADLAPFSKIISP